MADVPTIAPPSEPFALPLIGLDEVVRIMIEAGVAAEVVSGMLADAEFVAWVDYLANQAAIAADIAAGAVGDASSAAIWRAAADAITGVALAAARQGAQLVKGMVETQIRTIAETIAQGMADGLHPDAIARRLEMVQALDSNRAAQYLKFVDELEQSGRTTAEIERMAETRYQQLLRERREAIAQHETAQAQSDAYLTDEDRGLDAEALAAAREYMGEEEGGGEQISRNVFLEKKHINPAKLKTHG